MKNRIVVIITLGLLFVAAIIGRTSKSAPRPLAAKSSGSPATLTDLGAAKENAKFALAYSKLQLGFEANHGQIDSQAKFLSRGPGYTLFLTSSEAVLALRNQSLRKPLGPRLEAASSDTAVANVRTLRMSLLGARPDSSASGIQLLPGKSNYFIGNDPTKWRTNVPMYAKVKYEGVYPGVNLVYYGNQGQLEYDFLVAPGADPTRIRFSIDGVDKLATDATGALILDLAGATVRLLKPTAYQQMVGGRKEIAGRYALHGRAVGFEVGPYDRNEPLTIDPVLSYSTYLGGSSGAFSNAIAVDSSGNAYVTGGTAATDFPTKNPAQPTLGGNTDVFVTKLDPTGSSLIYSTYLGGTGYDAANSIAVDSSGNAYVTGTTQASNFPTKNPIQLTAGGGADAFVAKLDATGSMLVYSTYLGGSGDDSGNGIAVDASGNAYIAGRTGSINFPTKNPLQPAAAGGDDAFIAKVDTNGSTLVYSTYLGGSALDEARGIAVDAAGNAYVTGTTSSRDFPTKNPFQPNQNGSSNAFVTKLNPTGSALAYSTYIGGSTFDQGNGITIDSAGNAYVTGSTHSVNFPTKNPIQAALKSSSNAFVTKLDATGTTLVFSTYLGGSGNENGGDLGEGITLDSAQNVYVIGLTSSSDFPLVNPIQSSLVAQSCDFYYYGPYTCGNTAFVAEFNATGSALVFSSYMGSVGGGFEDGHGVALDGTGSMHVTGSTPSTNLLVTPGAFQLVGSPKGDAFVAKISPANAPGFSLSGFNFSFPDEGVNGTTQPIGITLANSGSATLDITSIVASGDFALAGPACPNSLAGGSSCSVNITFTPTAAGDRTGMVTFTDTAASSPQTVTLSGKGISGLSATVMPTSLNFNSQTMGITSPSQTVTLKNTGSATLTINGVSISGANPSAFSVSDNTCNGTLVVGASCTFGVAFAPQAVGSLFATLQIFDNSAQSPRAVALAGIGLAPPTVALSPSSLSFAAQLAGSTSPTQTVTLSTSGTGTLAIASINAGSNFTANNNCGGSVVGGGSCSITVAFTPTAAGNLSGDLVIVDNASNSPQMVPLSGIGADFSFSSASSSKTIHAGETASYTVNLSGTSAFNGSVQLDCRVTPPFANCSASPNPVILNGTTPVGTTVTVSTAACSLVPTDPVPIRPPTGHFLRLLIFWCALLLTLVVLWLAHREQRSQRRRRLVVLACLLFLTGLSVSCGGDRSTLSCQNGTPAGNYTITLTGSIGGASRSTTLTLTVR